jgi:hypothetical protein
MFPYSRGMDIASDIMAGVSIAAPVAVALTPMLFGGFSWDTALVTAQYMVMFAEAALLVQGTKDLVKGLAARNRPYTYFAESPPKGWAEDYWHSFPSGHSAWAFMGASFLSALVTLEFGESPWNWPLIATAYGGAVATAVFRITGGYHFLSDTLAGAAIVVLFGWGVPLLHMIRPIAAANDRVTVTLLPGGVHVGVALE